MKTLTISIPTRNRAMLLRQCLDALVPQVEAYADQVYLCVVDNCSTDNTRDVAQSYGPIIHYLRHTKDIGGCENISFCYTNTFTEYAWVIGDDDLILPDGVNQVLRNIRDWRPDWMILNDGRHCRLTRAHYMGLSSFALDAAEHDPFMLITPGTIYLNVIRRECYDPYMADNFMGTNSYPHFFAILSRLTKPNALITMLPTQIIADVTKKPRPTDGKLPPRASEAYWRTCMQFYRELYSVPLDLDCIAHAISQDHWIEFWANPAKFISKYWELIKLPTTWPRIFNRIRYLLWR